MNVTQSQKVDPFMAGLRLLLPWKPTSIIRRRFHELMLALLLLDLGDGDPGSLENLCLKYISGRWKLRSLAVGQLPKYLQEKLERASLSRHLVGAWSGNHLIITGCYSNFSPFPPDGEWKEGNLFKLNSLSHSHADKLCSGYRSYQDYLLAKLYDFCNGKTHIVVNLDKKE